MATLSRTSWCNVKRTKLWLLALNCIASCALPNSAASAELTWGIVAPTRDIRLDTTDRVSFVVEVSADVPAPALAIVQSTLQDPGSKHVVDVGALALSVPAPMALRQGPNRVELVVSPLPPPGQFVGTVAIALAGAQGVKSVELALYSTSRLRQFAGSVAIAVGILASWFVTIFAPHRAMVLNLKLPLTMLEERVIRLASIVQEATPLSQLHRLEAGIQRARDTLSAARGKLPSSIPVAIARGDVQTDALQALLDEGARQLAILNEIIQYGVRIALDQKLGGVLPQLDALADAVDAQQARAQVAALLAAGRGGPAVAGALPVAPGRASPEAVRVELSQLHGAVWLIWAGLTLVTGLVALILSNPGFGTGQDLAACFFWGLGVQIAGQQLQQLAPGKITTTLRVAVPT